MVGGQAIWQYMRGEEFSGERAFFTCWGALCYHIFRSQAAQ